jgi:hypothetical protein
MSLILDALRKAQRDRQLGQRPGQPALYEDRGGPRRRRRTSLAGVAAAIALAGLVVLALTRWSAAPKSVAGPAASPARPAPTAAARPQVRQPPRQLAVARRAGRGVQIGDASAPQPSSAQRPRAEPAAVRPPAQPARPPQPTTRARESEPAAALSAGTQPVSSSSPGASPSTEPSPLEQPPPAHRAPPRRADVRPMGPTAPARPIPAQTAADRRALEPSPGSALAVARDARPRDQGPAKSEPAPVTPKEVSATAAATSPEPEAPTPKPASEAAPDASARAPHPSEASAAGQQSPAALALTKLKPEAGKAIPLVSELPSEERRDLDKLEINGHVYTEDASQRFVFINLRIYHVGDRIGANGPVVKEITPDGAILDYGAGLALLPIRKQGPGAK